MQPYHERTPNAAQALHRAKRDRKRFRFYAGPEEGWQDTGKTRVIGKKGEPHARVFLTNVKRLIGYRLAHSDLPVTSAARDWAEHLFQVREVPIYGEFDYHATKGWRKS